MDVNVMGQDMTKNPLHSTITTFTTRLYIFISSSCAFPMIFPCHYFLIPFPHTIPLLTFYLQMTFPEGVYFAISSFSFLTYSRELYLVMDLLLLLLYSDKDYRDSPPIYEC